MLNYIFKEEEWMNWSGAEYKDSIELLDGQKFTAIKIRGIIGGLSGRETVAKDWFFLGVNVFGPGGSYETHKHKCPQFYYILSGRAKMRVGDGERIVEKGTRVFTPPRIEHYHENIGDEDFAYILIGGGP